MLYVKMLYVKILFSQKRYSRNEENNLGRFYKNISCSKNTSNYVVAVCVVVVVVVAVVVFVRYFNVHIQSKLLQHTPVMGTHSSYKLGCLSRTEG